MNLNPITQTNLYGLNDYFNELALLYKDNRLPSKILFSGPKGVGKSTLSYHLVNFILSMGNEFSYDLDKLSIDKENKDYKLLINGSNPNFLLIDVSPEKKMIDISQIRNLINILKKTSFNSKPRFILIDNIEYLNLNSINALLKILEEPPENTYFLLVQSNNKITPTLSSRCLNFKINISNKDFIKISNKLLNANIFDLINKDLVDYYSTPGKIFNLVKFSRENDIDIKELDLKNFLTFLIDKSYYKKDSVAKSLIFDFLELYLVNKFFLFQAGLSNYFLNKINNTKMYNLDDETLFLEIRAKLLNE